MTFPSGVYTKHYRTGAGWQPAMWPTTSVTERGEGEDNGGGSIESTRSSLPPASMPLPVPSTSALRSARTQVVYYLERARHGMRPRPIPTPSDIVWQVSGRSFTDRLAAACLAIRELPVQPPTMLPATSLVIGALEDPEPAPTATPPSPARGLAWPGGRRRGRTPGVRLGRPPGRKDTHPRRRGAATGRE